MKRLEVVRGCDASELHLRQAVEIDKEVFTEELQGDYNNCLEWFKKNPNIYTFLVDATDSKVVGYANTMPITENLFGKIIRGEIVDTEIESKDILEFQENTKYILYFCSLVVHPEYQPTKAFSLLYDFCIKELLELTKKNIYFDMVVAEGATQKGARMCRLSGMEPVTTTKSGNTVYGLYQPNQYFKPLSGIATQLQEIYK